MSKETKQNTRIGSALVVAVLLLIALVGGLLVQCAGHAGGEAALVAKVTHDGEVVAVLPLSQNTRQVIASEDGGLNTVVIQDGGVHIEDANCAGGDCMKQGTIDSAGRLLVCLPHKLIVEIEPADSSAQTTPSAYTGEELVGQEGTPDIDVVAR